MKVDNNVTLQNELPRVDIQQKVSGHAKYTADQFPKNMIYARMIRFPYGKGTCTSANVDAAKKVPGIVEVELDTDKTFEYPGMSMGHIAGDSLQAIEDAMNALKLEFEIDRPATDPWKLYNGVPEVSTEDQKKLNDLFEKAHAVVEATYDTQVQTHSCLEPHGGVVDHRGDSAEAWGSTQGTFAYLGGLAGDEKSPTGLPPSKVVVHNEYVGGGFGSKFGPDKEGTLAARLSRKHKRPCKVMLDRREEHLDAGNRPGSIQYMKLAVDEKGKILGGRIHCANVVGYTEGGGGTRNPIDQLYDFGDYVKTEEAIKLNFSQPRAFRAPGWPQGVFAVDSMMDELAEQIGMDPLEFRKINETSDRRKKQLDTGAEAIGWKNRKATGSQKGIMRKGYGVAGALWPTWPTRCKAVCDIHRNGDVEVRSGVQDIGTGTFTVVADVAADELGIGREHITSKVGNSTYPEGPGSGGSVVTRSVTPAVRKACRAAFDELLANLADEWKIKKEDIVIDKGSFTNKDTEKTVSWKEACSILKDEKVTGNGATDTGTEGSGTSDCVQFAEVEVDTETGIVRVNKIVGVHACGQMVNRKTLENQICGGITQGISYALFEERRLDRNNGGMVNDGFIYYKLPGTVDIPDIIPILDANEQDTGARPIGEPATIPTSGAIANAVANALGVRVRSLPITPAKILAALEEKKGANA